MGEELEVRWRRARDWLETVRHAAARIEPLIREIAAMQEAYDSMLPWATTGGGSGGHGTHSDPTAAQAMARSESYDVLIADKRAKLDALYDIVGDCGRVLMRLGGALGDECSLALELYYIDCAQTWTDVAYEMGLTRKQLWRIREKSYGWIEQHGRLDL